MKAILNKHLVVACLIPTGLTLAGGWAVQHWLLPDEAWVQVEVRLPGQDDEPPPAATPDDEAPITGRLTRSDGVPADLPGQWPGFRGPGFDNIVLDATPLAAQWPQRGPRQLWSLEVGEGFAGVAIRAGRVYLMDYDREGQSDAIRCLSLADGKEIWRYAYTVKVKRWHGMSRTVPAVTERYVVTVGPKCHVTCVDAVSGEFLWMIDMVREYGTKVPQWYTSQCPLIEEGRAILAPAGPDCLMMAVDCASGEVVWQTPNPDGWVMTHSSVVPMSYADERFYVYCGGSSEGGGVVGVSATDGRVLWQTDQWRTRINVPLPVVVGENRLFLSAGYGQNKYGCAMLSLSKTGDEYQAALDFLYPPSVFGSMQQTPVFYENHVYGVGMNKQLVCLDLEGNEVWNSTSEHTFGFGPYLLAQGRLYILDDDGLLTLVSATPSGYNELDQTPVFEEGVECWGPMAMVGGRLILRDLTRLVCIDVGRTE